MKIDVHAHLYPMEYVALLDSFDGGRRTSGLAELRGGATDREMAERVAMMDLARVDMQLLSVSSMVPHFTTRNHAVEAARRANDSFAAVVRRFPGRFGAFASLPLPHLRESILELGRALDRLGMVGVSVTTEVLDRSLADPVFAPLFVELNRRGATLFIHPSAMGVHSAPMESLLWSIGEPAEDLLCLLQLVHAGVPDRFPNMHILWAHLGRCASFLTRPGELLEGLPSVQLGDLASVPERAARWFFYDTVNSQPAALRRACETFASEQLLLGSDMPHWRNEEYQLAVDYVAQAGLSKEQEDAICSGNALRLFPMLRAAAGRRGGLECPTPRTMI